MSDFKKSIKVNGIEYNLSFQLVFGPLYNKYFVKVHQLSEEPIAFEMKKGSAGIWTIIEPVPVGLKDIQEQLTLIIEEHQNK